MAQALNLTASASDGAGWSPVSVDSRVHFLSVVELVGGPPPENKRGAARWKLAGWVDSVRAAVPV